MSSRPVSSVRIARDGRVWVLPHQRPRGERVRWMGFEPDGKFLCHLQYSHSGLDPQVFGAVYWLVVQVPFRLVRAPCGQERLRNATSYQEACQTLLSPERTEARIVH